jgi:xanthine dehydrogenase FAD-binding subunit
VHLNEFSYHRPTSIKEAVALMAQAGAQPIVGGTDLIPQLRERRRTASSIVDLKHVPALTTIERTKEGGWRIGAAVSVTALGKNADFAAAHRSLLGASRLIGSLQVQSRASLVGNLCNAAPSADGVPLLLALAAEADIDGPTGRRRVAAETLPIGPGRTTLGKGEIVSAILLPPSAPRSASCYLRFTPRREMDIAVAGTGVAITLDEKERIKAAAIVLASVGPVPIRALRAEALLIGAQPTDPAFAAAGTEAAAECTPISDTRGSADYRRHLIAVLTRRALADCAAQIEGRVA